jgi:transcriptional regulator
MNERLKGHLDLLVLEVIATRPAHGYDVIVSLRDRSDGAFDLPEGTVYPALYRLERSGLLASNWTAESGRRRRVYALTATGRRALAAQRRQWREFASAVGAVLGVQA